MPLTDLLIQYLFCNIELNHKYKNRTLNKLDLFIILHRKHVHGNSVPHCVLSVHQ